MLFKNFMSEGWTAFKIKVGVNLQDDIRRCKVSFKFHYTRFAIADDQSSDCKKTF